MAGQDSIKDRIGLRTGQGRAGQDRIMQGEGRCRYHRISEGLE